MCNAEVILQAAKVSTTPSLHKHKKHSGEFKQSANFTN